MMVFRAGIHKMLVRIANREEPDQTASLKADLGLPCRSRPFGQAASIQNFRTFNIYKQIATYLPVSKTSK